MRFAALFLVSCVSLARGALVERIFKEVTSIATSNVDLFPGTPTWSASVSWSKNSSQLAFDTFVLHMPYVYQFTTYPLPLELAASGVNYASCLLFSGETIVLYSEIQCTATSAITDVTESVSGTASFNFFFNSGFDLALNLDAGNYWAPGAITIDWTDGSTTLTTSISLVYQTALIGTDGVGWSESRTKNGNQAAFFYRGYNNLGNTINGNVVFNLITCG